MTARPRSGAASDPSEPIVAGKLDPRFLQGVQVSLDAGLGAANLSVADLMQLKVGSVVDLNTQLNDLVELKLNGAVVARGELVAVEDHFAIRVVEIVPEP